VDHRDSPDSTNWGVCALIKYNGDQPAYIVPKYWKVGTINGNDFASNFESSDGDDFAKLSEKTEDEKWDVNGCTLFRKGDSRWYNISYENKILTEKKNDYVYNQDKMPNTLRILVHEYMTPTVDPEYTNFEKVSVSCGNRVSKNYFDSVEANMIDVRSIKYVVDENGWKKMVIELSDDGLNNEHLFKDKYKVVVTGEDKDDRKIEATDENGNSRIIEGETTLTKGEVATLEIQLGAIDPATLVELRVVLK